MPSLTPPRPLRSAHPAPLPRGARGAWALLALLPLTSCGREGPSEAERIDGPPLAHEEVALSLLESSERRTVVAENPARGVRVDLLRPRGGGSEDFAELPALEAAPPSEVRCVLPDCGPDARLRFAVGIEEDGYTGGEVDFEVEFDGEIVFERTLPSSPDVPDAQRRWWPAEVAVPHGGELVLRTSCAAPGDEPPRAAFGVLEVVTRQEVPRHRASPEHPNLVLVVIDTLRADALSPYGAPAGDSPILDRLAESGTLFEEAFVPAPWTAPSTASILTGLSPPDHGLGFSDSNYLPGDLTTLAEVMVRQGMVTAGFSCNPLVSVSRNHAQGFTSYRDFPPWAQGEDVMPEVEDWVTEHQDERFFLYLHVVDPHGPYQPAEPFREEYTGERPEGYPEHSVERFMLRFWEDPDMDPGFLRDVARFNRGLYQGEVASIDRLLGELFAQLHALDLLDRTVIAVTSDHGEEFMDHGLMGHVFQLHRELVHVPLILSGPGVPAGQRVSERVEVRFLGTTLLQLAGLDTAGIDGPNLLDAEERAGAAVEPLFFTTRHGRYFADGKWQSANGLHGALAGDWLLFWSRVREHRGHPCTFLFDLSSDPEARQNVASDHPEVVERLKRHIVKWLDSGARTGARAQIGSEADLQLLQDLGYLGAEDDE